MTSRGVGINLGSGSSDEDPATGLLALVMTVVEILISTMEREAVRRMEAGRLSDDEIERLGMALQSLDEEVARIKTEEGIEDEVERLRTDLDTVIRDAIHSQPVEPTGQPFGERRADRPARGEEP